MDTPIEINAWINVVSETWTANDINILLASILNASRDVVSLIAQTPMTGVYTCWCHIAIQLWCSSMPIKHTVLLDFRLNYIANGKYSW